MPTTPRILGRRDDGTLLIGLTAAGVIYTPGEGTAPVRLDALASRGAWQDADEPLPEGTLTSEELADLEQRETDYLAEYQRLLDLGNPPQS